jgi:hypothetical protein
MAQLQSRYDALSEVKERATERYKTDYQKWRKLKNWLFTYEEEGAKGKDGRELSAEEKKRLRNKAVMMKKELVMKLGPDYAENHNVDGSEHSFRLDMLDFVTLILPQRQHHILRLWAELHHCAKNAIPKTTKRTKPPQKESDGD